MKRNSIFDRSFFVGIGRGLLIAYDRLLSRLGQSKQNEFKWMEENDEMNINVAFVPI